MTTDSLSSESCVTVSAVTAVLHILKTNILAECSDDTPLTSDIKKSILQYINQKYEPDNIKTLLNLASFLDPRFCTSYIDDIDKDEVIDGILDEGSELLVQKEQMECTMDHSSSPGPGDNAAQPPAKKRRLGSWLTLAQQTSQEEEQRAATPASPLEKVQREIEQYQCSPRADPDSNPLEWWKKHCGDYVVLPQLAKKYLCITASSTPSERVFSTSGLIVSKKRTCLKPEKVNMLVFLSKNL